MNAHIGIIYLLFVGLRLAGCTTGTVKREGFDQNGNPAWPMSANETPGPGKGPSGRF